MNDQSTATEPADQAEAAEPTLAERLAHPLRIDFDKLADAIRANEQGKTIPDGVRDLFDLIAQRLRDETFPDLDQKEVGLALLAAASVAAILADDGPDWTALSIANTLASVGQRLWHSEPDVSAAPDFFRAGITYVNGTIYQPPEVAIVFRCVAVAEHPRSGEGPIAFGFACRAHPGDNWTHYLANQTEWDQGWRVYHGLAFQPGEQPAAADEASTAEKSERQHQAAADIQDLTDELFADEARTKAANLDDKPDEQPLGDADV